MTNLKIIRATLTMLIIFTLGYFYGLNNSYQAQEEKLTTIDIIQSKESLGFKIAKIITLHKMLEKARYETSTIVHSVELNKDNTKVRLLARNFMRQPINNKQSTCRLMLLTKKKNLINIIHKVDKYRFSDETALNRTNTGKSVQKPIEKALIPLGYTIRGPTFSGININGETV